MLRASSNDTILSALVVVALDRCVHHFLCHFVSWLGRRLWKALVEIKEPQQHIPTPEKEPLPCCVQSLPSEDSNISLGVAQQDLSAHELLRNDSLDVQIGGGVLGNGAMPSWELSKLSDEEEMECQHDASHLSDDNSFSLDEIAGAGISESHLDEVPSIRCDRSDPGVVTYRKSRSRQSYESLYRSDSALSYDFSIGSSTSYEAAIRVSGRLKDKIDRKIRRTPPRTANGDTLSDASSMASVTTRPRSIDRQNSIGSSSVGSSSRQTRRHSSFLNERKTALRDTMKRKGTARRLRKSLPEAQQTDLKILRRLSTSGLKASSFHRC